MLNSKFFPNQRETASKLKAKLEEGHRVVVLKSEMQTGKTGVIECLLEEEYSDTKKALFTTGLSDLDLYTQSSQRLKEVALVEKLSYLVKDNNASKMISGKRINLLIIDECHYGIGNDSRLDKFFEQMESWTENFPHLQVVYVSATPFEHSLLSNYPQVTMEVPNNYFGITEILNLPKFEDVREWSMGGDSIYLENLEKINTGIDIAKRFKPKFRAVLDDFVGNFSFGLGLIRAKDINEAALIKEAIKNSYNNKISPLVAYSQEHKDRDGTIQEMTKQAKFDSKDKRVIFITLGGLTAGYDFDKTKERIRFVVELNRGAIPTAVQGLPGRVCGYHNNRNIKVVASRKTLGIYSEWARGRMNELELRHNLADSGYRAGTHLEYRSRHVKPFSKGISFKGDYNNIDELYQSLPERYQLDGLRDALNMVLRKFNYKKSKVECGDLKQIKLTGMYPIGESEVRFNSQSWVNYTDKSKFNTLFKEADSGNFNFDKAFILRSEAGRKGEIKNINYGLLFGEKDFRFIIKSDKVDSSTTIKERHNVSNNLIQ